MEKVLVLSIALVTAVFLGVGNIAYAQTASPSPSPTPMQNIQPEGAPQTGFGGLK